MRNLATDTPSLLNKSECQFVENFKKMIPYEKPDIDIVESTFRYIKDKVILKAEINNNGTRND